MKQNNSIIYPILTKYILNMCPEFTYKAIYNKNQKNKKKMVFVFKRRLRILNRSRIAIYKYFNKED